MLLSAEEYRKGQVQGQKERALKSLVSCGGTCATARHGGGFATGQ